MVDRKTDEWLLGWGFERWDEKLREFRPVERTTEFATNMVASLVWGVAAGASSGDDNTDSYAISFYSVSTRSFYAFCKENLHSRSIELSMTGVRNVSLEIRIDFINFC